MSQVLRVSSSAFQGNVGWAWSLGEAGDAGAFVGGTAYRGALHAAVEGLREVPAGTALEVKTSNDTLHGVATEWMASWRERDWIKKGGIKHLDLVKQLSAEDARLTLTWTLCTSSEPDFKPLKAQAQAARKTLPAPDPTEPASPVAGAAGVVQPTAQRILAYTDGGCRRNPGGVGGWGMLLIDTRSGASLERWGGHDDTTNNRMEMQAAIEVLTTLKGEGRAVEIRTDSKYLCDVASKWLAGWKRRGWTRGDGEPVANVDLVQQIDALQSRHRVVWTWVRGHHGEPGNEHVDALCNRAMDAVAAGTPASGETRFAESPIGPVGRVEPTTG